MSTALERLKAMESSAPTSGSVQGGSALQRLQKFDSSPKIGSEEVQEKEDNRSLLERISEGIQGVYKFAYQDIPVGVLKGVASTATSAAEIGSGMLDKGIGAFGIKPDEEFKQQKEETLSGIRTSLEPKNLGQRLGKTGEQIGEFFTPIGVEGAAARLGSKLAVSAPRFTKFAAEAIPRAASSAVEFGAKTFLQTGEKEEAISAAEFGAVTSPITGMVGSILGKMAPNLSKYLEQVNLRLTPPQKTKLGGKLKTVVDWLSKQKVTGTPEVRTQKVAAIYDDMEDAFQKFLNIDAKGVTVPRSRLIKELEAVKVKYKHDRDVDQVERQVDSVIKMLKERWGENIPVDALNILKRSTMKGAFNGAGDKVLDDVEYEMGSALTLSIEKATGKLRINGMTVKEFNKEYGTAITAMKLLKIAQGRNEIGLMGRLISTAVGMKIGSFAGPFGSAGGALVGQGIAGLVAGTPVRAGISAGLQTASRFVPGVERTIEAARRFGASQIK